MEHAVPAAPLMVIVAVDVLAKQTMGHPFLKGHLGWTTLENAWSSLPGLKPVIPSSWEVTMMVAKA